MQNLRHPRWGSADLGENRRIWGVRRTKVRRAPKSAIEKARIKYGEFRRNSTDYCLISKISESGGFFSRAFSISSNMTAPKLCSAGGKEKARRKNLDLFRKKTSESIQTRIGVKTYPYFDQKKVYNINEHQHSKTC